MDKKERVQKLKTTLAESIYGITLTEAHEEGICLQCREDAIPNCYSEAGKREYQITGLCERCFDRLMEEDEK